MSRPQRTTSSNRGPAALDYAAPDAADARIQRVLGELRMDETLGWAAGAVKLGLGVPLCFLPSALFTVLLVGFGRERYGLSASEAIPVFIVSSAVLIPVLIWLERRTRGDFLLDALRGEPPPQQASSYGEYQMQSDRFRWAAYTEIALLGPRLILDVFAGASGRGSLSTAERLVAARIVLALHDAGQGVPVRDLWKIEPPGLTLAQAMRHLRRLDWIGVAAAGDRVWLSSPIRQRLAAA
jgi:hypothetical protein